VDEVGKVLPSLFKQQIQREQPRLLEILIPLWPRISGKTIAQHSRPALFTSGVLTLATDCETWTTQLRHMSKEIRAGINGFLGQAVVKKLRIRTVYRPMVFSALPSSCVTSLPPLPPTGLAMDTAVIADRDVACALANSYVKYFNRPRR